MLQPKPEHSIQWFQRDCAVQPTSSPMLQPWQHKLVTAAYDAKHSMIALATAPSTVRPDRWICKNKGTESSNVVSAALWVIQSAVVRQGTALLLSAAHPLHTLSHLFDSSWACCRVINNGLYGSVSCALHAALYVASNALSAVTTPTATTTRV